MVPDLQLRKTQTHPTAVRYEAWAGDQLAGVVEGRGVPGARRWFYWMIGESSDDARGVRSRYAARRDVADLHARRERQKNENAECSCAVHDPSGCRGYITYRIMLPELDDPCGPPQFFTCEADQHIRRTLDNLLRGSKRNELKIQSF
ncbi:hypothetical protein AB0A77_01890 [Streptomyces varsoviensis]|uniref:hypothetical protein n=1 Tax=Streptomyces varsoviensis TaxID=67373 RepID=UPI0033F871A0